MTALKYRAEIDGLRAIAVVAVIIYHAGILFHDRNILGGGFIGVDIFFVISGYLITSIILGEIGKGTFRLKNFYIRRIRRILPVLFTVMLVTLPYAWFNLMPFAARDYAGSILSSLFFVSNYWFAEQDTYWAVEEKLKPFLHTWSLSVEEQFYVLYPLILAFIWKRMPQHLFKLMLAGFVLSLILAHVGSIHFDTEAFYFLPMRGWELLAGGLLAKREIDRGRASTAPLAAYMPKIGLVLIAASFFLFDSSVRHPSLYTLAPVLGAMLLIWFCREGELVTKILSSRLMVAIGLISYGLYIWHYPIFAFAQVNNPHPVLTDKFAWIAAALALATTTYFLVERPARNFKTISTRTLILCLAAAFTLIAAPATYAYINNGNWGRFAAWQAEFLNGPNAETFPGYVSAGYDEHVGLEFPEATGNKRLAIIGDSFSQDFYNILNEGDLLDGIDVVTHYIPARCQVAPADADFQKHIEPAVTDACAPTMRPGHPGLQKLLQQADMIIIAAAWQEYTTSQLPALRVALKKQSKAPVLIIGRKEFYRMKLADMLAIQNHADIIKIKRDNLDPAHYRDIKRAAQILKPTGDYIDLHYLICGQDPCPVSTPDGSAMSYDGYHLTEPGAQYVAGLLKTDKKFMRRWNAVFRQ